MALAYPSAIKAVADGYIATDARTVTLYSRDPQIGDPSAPLSTQISASCIIIPSLNIVVGPSCIVSGMLYSLLYINTVLFFFFFILLFSFSFFLFSFFHFLLPYFFFFFFLILRLFCKDKVKEYSVYVPVLGWISVTLLSEAENVVYAASNVNGVAKLNPQLNDSNEKSPVEHKERLLPLFRFSEALPSLTVSALSTTSSCLSSPFMCCSLNSAHDSASSASSTDSELNGKKRRVVIGTPLGSLCPQLYRGGRLCGVDVVPGMEGAALVDDERNICGIVDRKNGYVQLSHSFL